MSIKCRFIKQPKSGDEKPGDMFYVKYVNREEPHLIVILPNGAQFDLTHAGDKSHKIHWEVSGEPPNMTVEPSILMEEHWKYGSWHGWLKEGVLIDA